MANLLEVSGLTITRGATRILRGINWRIHSGEHWALLGANGSGKTSLLKALTGYLAPTAGAIEVLGFRYGRDDWRDLRLQVGVVTSSFAASIPAAEPVVETVVSGKFAQLDLWRPVTPADRTTARKWLRFVGLAKLEDRPWAFLSQGERQRALIARALMANPKLLFLDEPCAGLDPVARDRFLRFLQTLTRRRAAPTLVLVTHHVEEIVPGISHALLLRRGQTLAAGPRRETLAARNLSRVFGARLRVIARRGRLDLRLARA